MSSEDLDEDALFELGARVMKKTVQRESSGGSKNVDVPGLLAGCQDVGMNNMSTENHRDVSKTTPPSAASHAISTILPYRSPPLVKTLLVTEV